MRKTTYIAFLIVIVAFITSCSSKPTINSTADYVVWMNKEENGLIKSKTANGVKLTMKYLSPTYQALREQERTSTNTNLDSLKDAFSKSMTFLLNIAPDENKTEGDIMYKALTDYEGYKERMHDLNFRLDQYINLKIGESSYVPVLTSMENTYGLTQDRNFTLAFVPITTNDNDFYKGNKIDVVFEDEFFGTGINHFVFEREKINASDLEVKK